MHVEAEVEPILAVVGAEGGEEIEEFDIILLREVADAFETLVRNNGVFRDEGSSAGHPFPLIDLMSPGIGRQDESYISFIAPIADRQYAVK